MTAIRFDQVSKWFGQVQALSNVSLSVRKGEFVSLIGPSGCGKTTLLRLAAGLIEPTTGEVWINGDPPSLACQEHRIGVAFQETTLLEWKTLIGNIQLTLDITQSPNGLCPEELLRDFGLEQFEHSYPHELSGGMRQRGDIACAVAHNPPILLLDEPFGALDEMTREKMGDWLNSVLEDTKQTVLFITHSIGEAVALSDRVVILTCRPGRILEVVDINLRRPRTADMRESIAYMEEVVRVRKALRDSEEVAV